MAKKITIGDIDAEKFEAAIHSLEGGGTKKQACELLGIRYNTRKLDELIHAYKDRMLMRKRMVQKMRAKPVSKDEVASWVQEYLGGASLSDIAERSFRSTAVVKYHLTSRGLLLRSNGSVSELESYEVPENRIALDFSKGEMAWSPKHNCLVEIVEQRGDIVKVITISSHQKNAFVYSWEIASLVDLEDLGVNLKAMDTRLDSHEVNSLIQEGLKKALMKKRT